MKTMDNSVLIIDDDRLVCEELKDLLADHFPDASVVEVCNSGEAGVKAIRTHKPDLLFLDIMMPGMNGFEVLHQVTDYRFDVIFVTAFNEYAIEAIRHSAVDYLLKPLRVAEFIDAVKRYLVKRDSVSSLNKKIENLEHNLAEKEINQRQLVIHSLKGSEVIPESEIMYCTSESNYTEIHLANGKRLLASKTLGYFEEQLSEGQHFIRIHRSTLLNRAYITRLGSKGLVELHNGHTLEVSQRKLSEVRRWVAGK